MPATLTVLKNPFDRDSFVTSEVEPGRPVSDYAPSGHVHVLNGVVVKPDTILLAGDELIAYARPGDPFSSTFLASLLVSAILTGISFGLQAFARPPRTGTEPQLDASPTYGFSGLRNTVTPNTRLAVIYGRHRFGGQIIEQYFETISQNAGRIVTELGICIGPIENISDLRINQNGVQENTQNLQVGFTRGEEDQPGFDTILKSSELQGTGQSFERAGSSAVFTQSIDQAITAAGGVLTFVTDTACNRFEIIIRFVDGLYTLTRSGRFEDRSVTFSVRYRELDSGGPFITIQPRFVAATASTIDRFVSVDVPRGFYEIQISRITADFNPDSDPGIFIGDSQLVAIQEVTSEVFQFPYLARAIVVQGANEQVSGSAPDYDFLVDGSIVKVYSDLSTFTEIFSRNPAWILYDFLTNPLRGLGAFVKESNLILQDFLDWAEFCDVQVIDPETNELVPQFQCDIVIDGSLPAIDIIKQILVAGRANFVKKGAKWGVRIERPEEPRQLFQMTRISRDSFSSQKISKKTLPNYLIGEFANAELDYEIDTLPKEDQALVEGSDIIEQTVNLIGVTRVDQANRLLNYLSLSNRLQRRIVEFEVDARSIISEPGDVIRVSHDVALIGTSGVVRSIVGSSLELDRTITMQSGKTYEITVYYDDVNIDILSVQTQAGERNRITITSTPQQTIEQGTHYAFGEIGTSTAKYRILSIAGGSVASRRRIRAKEYDERVYEDDLTVLERPFVSSIGNPSVIPGNPRSVRVIESQIEDVDGTLIAALNVFYTFRNTIRPRAETFYRRLGEDSWRSTGVTTNSFVRITEDIQTPGVTYEISVIAVAQDGGKPNPENGEIVTITTSTETRRPGNVTNLRGDRTTIGFRFTWDLLTTPDVAFYEIRRGQDWDSGVLVGRVPGTTNFLETSEIFRGENTFLIKAFNSVGNESATALGFVVDIPGRIDENIIVEIDEDPDWTGILENFVEVSDQIVLDPTSSPVGFRGLVQSGALGGMRAGGFGQSEFKLEGSYTCAKVQLTTGDAIRLFVSSVIKAAVGDLTRTWTGTETGDKTWTGDFGKANTWEQNIASKARFRVEWRFSETTSADVDFGPWEERSQTIEVTAKWAQARIVATVQDPSFSVTIDAFKQIFDKPALTVSGTVVTSASGTVSATFSRVFGLPPEVSEAILSASGGEAAEITDVTTTGFDISVRNAGGSRVARTVQYIARGF